MKRSRIIWVMLSSVIVCALACSLPGTLTKKVGEQIDQRIEDQLKEALAATGNEELAEEFSGMLEQLSVESLGELAGSFSSENWTREDIPLPPDAEIIAGYAGKTEGDFVLLKTSMSIAEAEAWMTAELEADGWREENVEVLTEQARALNFTKADEGLALVLNSSPDSKGTHIWITLYPLNR